MKTRGPTHTRPPRSKRVAAVTVAAMAGLTLAACGGGSSGTNDSLKQVDDATQKAGELASSTTTSTTIAIQGIADPGAGVVDPAAGPTTVPAAWAGLVVSTADATLVAQDDYGTSYQSYSTSPSTYDAAVAEVKAKLAADGWSIVSETSNVGQTNITMFKPGQSICGSGCSVLIGDTGTSADISLTVSK